MKYNLQKSNEKSSIKTIQSKIKLTNYQREKLLAEIIKGDFNFSQRQQIILGAKEGIDFWLYAKPEISCLQMEEVRMKLKNEIK